MRKRIVYLLGIVVFLCSPCAAIAQPGGSYEVPPAIFTGPLSHPRYEEGGFFIGFDFIYWKTNRTLASMTVASRGFLDIDGSVLGQGPNRFQGSGEEALN